MRLQGKSIYNGIAIGQVAIFSNKAKEVCRRQVDDADAEEHRFEQAKEATKAQLQELYDKALKEVGESNAAIFEVHQMMLEDLDFVESIVGMIHSERVNAEYAVKTTADNFSQMFATMDDDYMRARAIDVKDIGDRVIRILSGETSRGISSNEPVIVLADDLAPSETVQMDKTKVLAFVTRHGSTNSHTAILARTMNIPALIGVDYPENVEGRLAIVDGFTGEIIIEPDSEVLEAYKKKQKELDKRNSLLQELKGKPNVTKDGREIKLYANIGGVGDIPAVLENDAGGIGLFRSEFLYLNSEDYPTEEEQFAAYKAVAEAMEGRTVVIRTLDIGADKKVDYFNLDKEENPALGYRAIRICLDRTEMFKTQLRAILRASRFGNISVMYPMIISLDELLRAKELMEEARKELDQAGIEYGQIEQGVMIETPAAVWISEELGKEADFFSIGTNDLSQYTLAIDRQNPNLDNFFDPHHPAILRAIEMTVENGHKGGAWVGICGELGADTSLTETFINMGVDELSVSPSQILKVREVIRSIG